MEYVSDFHLGEQGKQNNIHDFSRKLFTFIEKFKSIFHEFDKFTIIPNKYARVDLPSYTPPKYLPEGVDEFIDVMNNLKQMNILQLLVKSSPKKDSTEAWFNVYFVQDSFMGIKFFFQDTDANFIARHHSNILKLIGELFSLFHFRYGVEKFYDKLIEFPQYKLSYGWAIFSHEEYLGKITEFPVTEIVPGLVRVSSIAPDEIFDVHNPTHIEKGRALEKLIRSNSFFVGRVHYLTAFTSDDEE